MKEEPCRIDSGSGWLAGMLHEPAGPPRGSLVVCNPLFEERKPAQRILVETARAFCGAGYAVLRFDYRGCGDSSGEFDSFSVADWEADIAGAAAFLKSRAGSGPAGFLGLRLGASLGMKACSQDCFFQFAVLWEPVLQGREYLEQELRRKLMKEMMTFGRSQVSRDFLIQELAAGRSIDFDGHPVTPALYRDLGSVDMAGLPAPLPGKALILGIGSSERPSPAYVRCGESLRQAGMACEVRALREQPFWNLVGLVSCPALIRETLAWCQALTD
jgi:exosortase A-associated hydrolase 2